MSAGSPKFTVSRIAALSLVSLWLAGCTSSSNPPAPVTSVDSGSSSNTNSGMLITPPPKMGATPQQAPQIQPVQRPVTQPMQTQPVTEQPVQMENGRIVYNRQYGNIPKGSYTGGSTYTVKKGDTLFYIAWITGNDFRDLAQRNSISAPYSLNVGQTLQVGNASGTPITGRYFNRLGPRPLIIVGCLLQAAGILLLTNVTPATSHRVLMMIFALMGAGGSLCSSTAQSGAFLTIARRDMPDASALWNLNRQLSFFLGATLLTLLLNALQRVMSLEVAYRWTFIAAAGITLLPLIYAVCLNNRQALLCLKKERS
ncbi:major facilitator family transporter protein [Salmonella enterica subsp. enterica serovar Typhi]|nr:major facilitator family transporter protein [Salmonella enterica subsp. enterica serovar Typhi]